MALPGADFPDQGHLRDGFTTLFDRAEKDCPLTLGGQDGTDRFHFTLARTLQTPNIGISSNVLQPRGGGGHGACRRKVHELPADLHDPL